MDNFTIGEAEKQAAALAGTLWPTGKPDGDNMVKLYSDSLNKIVWRDDSQIVRLRFEKRYGAYPETILTVETIEGILE